MSLIIRPSIINNNPRQQCRWQPFPSTSSLQDAAVRAIFNAANKAVSQRGAFHLVLAGGNTPRRVYELLRTIQSNWRAWHIYFGDERCLPADHAERNSHMAAKAWLHHVGIPASQIHNIPAEQGAQAAAAAYAKTLNTLELFDLVLLGLGEDGHTASLFPHHDWGAAADAPLTLAIYDAPKPPPQRVSLSARCLGQTRQLIFLVSGTGKRPAVMAWRHGKDIPATAIAPACGVDVYLEASLLAGDTEDAFE